MPSAATAEARGQSAPTHATSQRSEARSASFGPKIIGGIGATLTLAAAAAVIMSNGPQPPGAPIAPVYSTLAAPAFADVATIAAPVSAPPAFVVAPAPPPSAPAYAAAPVPPQKQCNLPQRKFYVSGSGVIRVRDGDYISPPLVLEAYPQEVLFPLPRPEMGFSAQETIVVEGKASGIVMTSDLASFRKVIRNLRGASAFDIQWAPFSCR